MDVVIKSAAPGPDDLTLISAQARRELEAGEVYTFALRLCDNDIDRDLERFDDQALEELAGLFLGAPGILIIAGPPRARLPGCTARRWCGNRNGSPPTAAPTAG